MEGIKMYEIDDFTVKAELGFSPEMKPEISLTVMIEDIEAVIRMGYESVAKQSAAWISLDFKKVIAITEATRSMLLDGSGEECSFYEACQVVRKEFSRIAATYDVRDHNKLRTEIDTLLIMYDQAVDKAKKWDDLGEKIGAYYSPDKTSGEHLLDIGEAAATAFKYF